jgi:hypothetical protein
MRLQVLASVFTCVTMAGRLLGAGGTIQDQAVSLRYPGLHWGAAALADLLGTYASPTSDPLRASGYWYRIVGVDTREHRFPAPDSEAYVAGTLEARWSDVDGKGFSAVETTHVYDNERPSGTFTSGLTLTNHSASAMEVEIFHYLDVDVPGNADDDSVTRLASTCLRFSDLGGALVRYLAPQAHQLQVATYPALRDALNDEAVSNLDGFGAPFGPGNATAAYQWHISLAPGEVRDVAFVSVSVRAPSASIKGEGANRSGYPSLIFRRTSGSPALYTWSMLRTRSAESYGPVELGPDQHIVGADDFDGDCSTEYVQYDSVTGLTYVGQLQVTGVLPVSQPWLWNIEATGDFDHDGRPDIVWRNSNTRKIVIWRMGGVHGNNRLGDITPVPDHAVDANWAIKAALDFDGDGLRDLLWYNTATGQAAIWHMDAAVQRTGVTFISPASPGSGWKVVAAGDYGKGPIVPGAPARAFGAPDIVWQNVTTGKLVVWHMNFSGQRTAGVSTTPEAPDAGDPLDWEVVGPR